VESREFAPDYASRVQATRYDRLSQKHDEKWQWPYQIYRRDIVVQFLRVDVTEEFPFLVTKLSPYYDR
jgi:hypothetical protein